MQRSTTLQDFTVLQKLGEGSFGQVFKVKRNSDGQEYAMKRVRLNCLKIKERENALNEIRILASIKDNHIIGYKEAFVEDQSICVIMEYAAGGDIAKQIQNHIRKNQHIDENEIWRALVQMTLGLKVLHKSGILHRDLKCANVFRTQDGTYKIGDMNVSKVSYGALAKTQTGTPYYASPEVWKDQPYSSPSDIWSLGCVIYEMAAQKPPFRAQDLKSLFKKVQSGIYDKIPKTYSKDLNTMIAQLLKVPPHLRPTCDQILNDQLVKTNAVDWIPQDYSSKAELLQTILLPKNIKQLQGKLPKPMYDLENNQNAVNLLKEQPKSTRSISVNEKQSQRAISQTPQNQRKQPDQRPSIKNPPLIPKSINQERPKSAIRAQSPSVKVLIQKSPSKQNIENKIPRRQSAQQINKK